MRRGFTMIELIFVIVIIGILAAVAIPKLANTSIEAKKAQVIGFVGTLNRTVGPTMWAKTKGSVTAECANISNYIDVPTEVVTMANDCTLTVNSDLPTPTDNNFTDGTSVESPRWTITFP